MKIFTAVVAVCLTTANAYIPVGPIIVEKVQAKSLTPPVANIVGGTDAGVTTAPYMVSLVANGWFGMPESHICGGSLIGSKTVLTAAHCCDSSTASTLKVKYGGVDRTNLPITNQISQVIIHPWWNFNTIDYDYCILRLTNNVITSTTVQLISVASSRPADGTQAQLTGWGKTSGSTNTLPILLQKVNMAILNHIDCNNRWSDYDGQIEVTERMICGTNPAASGCKGDSGGPLTVNGALVGIVSWGANGCPSDTTVCPTVYADPVTVADWISNNIV